MQGLLDAIVNQDGVRGILKLLCFIQYASRLKNEILLAQKSSHLPNIVPQFLPISVVKFLASSCILSEQEVEECWKVIKELVWSAYILDDKAMLVAFKDHGTDKGFSSSTLASIVKQNNYITIQFQLVIFGLPHNSAPILIVMHGSWKKTPDCNPTRGNPLYARQRAHSNSFLLFNSV